MKTTLPASSWRPNVSSIKQSTEDSSSLIYLKLKALIFNLTQYCMNDVIEQYEGGRRADRIMRAAGRRLQPKPYFKFDRLHAFKCAQVSFFETSHQGSERDGVPTSFHPEVAQHGAIEACSVQQENRKYNRNKIIE